MNVIRESIINSNISLIKIILKECKMDFFGEEIIESDNIKILKLFLDYDEFYNMKNYKKQNIAHLICMKNTDNSIRLMKELFHNIYEIDLRDFYGKTPLSYALENFNEKMVLQLLEFGANPNNIREFVTNESLIYLKGLINLKELSYQQQIIIYYLIKSGANFHMSNFWGETADDYFIILQHNKMISDYVMDLITSFVKEKDKLNNNGM